MTNVDQFESAFRSAAKIPFSYEQVSLRKVLVITDVDASKARDFGDLCRAFLSFLSDDEAVQWQELAGAQYATVRELLEHVEQFRPDLICTYRNLHSRAWQWPYSLGAYVDLLTQVTAVPVLLVPHPDAEYALERALKSRKSVMALTDHLTGDAHLVNYAVGVTEEGGTLFLTHIEDREVYERYVDVIGKIPSIDTENARGEILEQLLKEPSDYIDSCAEVLSSHAVPVTVEKLVGLGHHLAECLKLVEEKHVDLVVFNTKDADQLAMHGLAYPLAVEMRQIPLLML